MPCDQRRRLMRIEYRMVLPWLASHCSSVTFITTAAQNLFTSTGRESKKAWLDQPEGGLRGHPPMWAIWKSSNLELLPSGAAASTGTSAARATGGGSSTATTTAASLTERLSIRQRDRDENATRGAVDEPVGGNFDAITKLDG